MTTPESIEHAEQVRKAYADYLATRIRSTADGLRSTATRLDGIAAEANLLNPVHRPGTAASLAQRAVAEVTWGVANAKPDAIVNAAADYDRVVAPAMHTARVADIRRLLDEADPYAGADRTRALINDLRTALDGEAGA